MSSVEMPVWTFDSRFISTIELKSWGRLISFQKIVPRILIHQVSESKILKFDKKGIFKTSEKDLFVWFGLRAFHLKNLTYFNFLWKVDSSINFIDMNQTIKFWIQETFMSRTFFENWLLTWLTRSFNQKVYVLKNCDVRKFFDGCIQYKMLPYHF